MKTKYLLALLGITLIYSFQNIYAEEYAISFVSSVYTMASNGEQLRDLERIGGDNSHLFV